MHPELLNNSLFLRYYKQWQDNPGSIVFVSIAEYFLSYGMTDEAFKICREGLKKHPALVSGRIMMAKIHIKRGNWEEAEEELRKILNTVPVNKIASDLLEEVLTAEAKEKEIEEARLKAKIQIHGNAREMSDDSASARSNPVNFAWNTITMANVYATQGLYEQARSIYKAILDSDPQNEHALKGLEALP